MGGKTETKIVVSGKEQIVKKGHNNFYSLKYMLKRNYGDIKNMIYTSQYNLKFKLSRIKYFNKKVIEWLI